MLILHLSVFPVSSEYNISLSAVVLQLCCSTFLCLWVLIMHSFILSHLFFPHNNLVTWLELRLHFTMSKIRFREFKCLLLPMIKVLVIGRGETRAQIFLL